MSSFVFFFGLTACVSSGLIEDTKPSDAASESDTDTDADADSDTDADADADADTDADADADADDTDIWDTDFAHTGQVQTVYALSIEITADDAWAMWIDGTPAGDAVGWNYTNVHDTQVSLTEEGEHVIAVHGYDVYNVIAGFLAVAALEGQPLTMTGDGQWKMSTTQPAPGWNDRGFDASSWTQPIPCESGEVNTYWGNRPQSLTSQGARWVWHGNCRALGEAWFRFSFTVP